MEIEGPDRLPSQHTVPQRMQSTLGRGIPITTESREIVCKVYQYFVTEALTFKRAYCGYFNKVQQRVVDATGVSKGTVRNLLDERDKLNSSSHEETSGKSDIIISHGKRLRAKKVNRKTHKMQSREIIYNVYGYITMERDKFKNDEKYFNKVQVRVAEATGISRPTISKIIKAIDEYGALNCNASKMVVISGSMKAADNRQSIEFQSDIYASGECNNDLRMSDTEASSEPEYILGLE